jgi:hypothetical protein
MGFDFVRVRHVQVGNRCDGRTHERTLLLCSCHLDSDVIVAGVRHCHEVRTTRVACYLQYNVFE